MKVVATTGIKGGVGKSMVSMNLAFELRDLGVRVGLLDADVDSPYASEVLRLKEKVQLDEERRMLPVPHEGLRVMSFSAWMPGGVQGVTMAGEQHQTWLRDALLHSDWGDTEVLVADLPAGSGDEYLSIVRAVRADLAGLVAVAQPNVVSGLARVYDAASYHHLRILGVIENMAGDVFGSGQVEAFCKERRLRFLGSIPLDRDIRLGHERGEARLPPKYRAPVRETASVVLEAAGLAPRAVTR